MNVERLRQSLLSAARRNPPSGAVPYAFEQRVMACLRPGGAVRPDPGSSLVLGLWKASIPAMAVALVLVGADRLIPGPGGSAGWSAAAFEETLLASAVPDDELWGTR
ncbi:MAG: hypothetical protein KF791_12185 [Verrucomicrobiae bacterium]|nr:hypothetical protein [Verrucomicrobiae bacterium]